MTTLECLTRLKRLFSSSNKWTKGLLISGTSTNPIGYCILGGMGKVTSGNWQRIEDNDNLIDKVTRALRLKTGKFPGYRAPLVKWNNDPNLTFEKFIARIDRAIARCQTRYGHRSGN
jgi:hypothetical protein